MKDKIKSLNKYITPIFYILLIVFIFFYIQKLNWSILETIKIAWIPLLIATILTIFFRYWGAIVWMEILKTLGAKDIKKNRLELFNVYSKAWLGRYIPGTAPWILGKIYFASKLGVSKNKLAVSSLLEGILQILVTFTSAILILLIDPKVVEFLKSDYIILISIILIFSILTLYPKNFNRIIKIIYKIIKKKEFKNEHKVTNKSVYYGAFLFLIGTIINGISFFFVAKSLYPQLGYENMLFILSASNLASAISMVAIFAPSGVGVREGIQIAMLSAVMPIQIATVIAIFTRIWSISIDFIFYGINALLTKLNKVVK